MHKPTLFSALATLLISVSIVLLYLPFTNNPLFFDDLRQLTPEGSPLAPIMQMQWHALEPRSLPYSSFQWSIEHFGYQLPLLRLQNLLLHLSNCIVLFFLLNQLFKQLLPNTKHLTYWALFAALLFALHPISTYATGYLIQRTILMATLFSLAALYSYTKAITQHNHYYLWLCAPLYYLALFSKEHSITLPATMLVMTMLLRADWKTTLKQQTPFFITLALIACSILPSKMGLIGHSYEGNAATLLEQSGSQQLPHLYSILTQSWLFFKYIILWLFPNPQFMSIDMREPFASGLWSIYLIALLGFITWGALAIKLVLKRGQSGLVGFVMIFPWLMFLTEFSTVRIQEPFVLYRSYLWFGFLGLLLPLIFSRLKTKTAFIICTLICITLFSISLDRLATMSHRLLLWDDTVKLIADRHDLPGVYRIYHNRGVYLLDINQPNKAIVDLKKSIQLYPGKTAKPIMYANLGRAYLASQQWAAAAQQFQITIDLTKLEGGKPIALLYQLQAQAFEQLGESRKAHQAYQAACSSWQKSCDKAIGIFP